MKYFNQKVWFITLVVTCLHWVGFISANPCAMDKIVENRILLKLDKTTWTDDKGYLTFHDDEPAPVNCESCSHLSKIKTDGGEICYTTTPDENDSDVTSICKQDDNTTETLDIDDYSFRKFSTIGLKVLSVTKYKIKQWLNIDQTFVDLTDLEYLYLESNHITNWTISADQKPLTSLRVLSLANNPIAYLSNESFAWLEGSKLEYLNLRDCSNINILDGLIFKPLLNSENLWLDLSYTIIEAEQLSNLTAGFKLEENSTHLGLKVLSLAHSALYKIPREALENIAHSLSKLSLQGNYLSNCWNTALDNEEDECLLPKLNRLEEINLRENSLTDFPFSVVLTAVPNLKALYLDENPLGEMSCNERSNVSYISLRNIKNDKGLKLCANGSKCSFPKLKTLDLSHSLINTTISSFNDLSNLKRLSLCNSRLRNITDLLKPLNNLEFLDLGNNRLYISLKDEDFKGLSNLKELNLQSCSIQLKSPSPFKYLENLEVLDISNNSIRNLNSSLFNGTEKLKTLILQENRIGAWKNNVFYKTLEHLHFLNLRNNWLTDITPAMISDLENMSELDISLNPLSCCSSRVAEFFETCTNFRIDFDGHCENEVFNFTLRNWKEPNAYMCVTEENEQKSVNEVTPKDCTTQEESYFTSSVAGDSSTKLSADTPSTSAVTATSITTSVDDTSTYGTTENATTSEGAVDAAITSKDTDQTMMYLAYASFVVIPLGVAVCYWKHRNIRTCARLFRSSMALSLIQDTKTKDRKKEVFQYDVFLSYSDRDREWILQQLIPNVEERCNIKVCLHERDFEAGLPVLENIMACMDHSRCVLLVLSEAFLRSQWCQFELNLAQHRLLELQHDRLILVLLEDIPRDKSSKMLRYLMLTKTYLVWPVKGDAEEKLLFWKKLKKAIGPVQDTVNVSFV